MVSLQGFGDSIWGHGGYPVLRLNASKASSSIGSIYFEDPHFFIFAFSGSHPGFVFFGGGESMWCRYCMLKNRSRSFLMTLHDGATFFVVPDFRKQITKAILNRIFSHSLQWICILIESSFEFRPWICHGLIPEVCIVHRVCWGKIHLTQLRKPKNNSYFGITSSKQKRDFL
jgi:hypothetical protein